MTFLAFKEDGRRYMEKNTNKKPSNLQAVLGELEAGKKAVPEYRILPPIPPELIQNDKGDSKEQKWLLHYSFKSLEYWKS